ncbi:hypothetical protein AB0I53_04005 [Saccharopolyspora sp. NPDC050389]|uniref:hypothetical protein n=1 Tax=Saccharopolyspora sp. NPDC050389 TaxID=3155516 RepID=UPI0033E6FA8E
MRVIASIMLLPGVVLTVLYIKAGLTATAAGDDVVFAWLNVWMAGPILLLFVVPMLFSNAPVGGDRKFRGAPIGRATVESVRRTGLTVNDRPQLELRVLVDTADGVSFSSTTRLIADLTELATLKPGLMLPVRYLPGEPARGVAVVRDAPPHEVQATLDAIQLAKGEITPLQHEIGTRGIDAQAVVMSMTPTGEIRGDKSVLDLTVRITRPDGGTFDIQQNRPVLPQVVDQMQPGKILRVRYLPADETDFGIISALN